MRILLVNTFIGCTSTGNVTYSIYQNVKSHGDDACIAYGREDRKNCPDSYKIGGKFDYSLHALLTRLTDKNGFYSKSATRKFIGFLETYKPDIVHLHNLHGYYLNVEILFRYLYKSRIPIVWTFHDCWPFTGHCPYYTNMNCQKWQSECNHCKEKEQYPASYLMDNSRYNYRKKRELFTLPNRMVVTPVSEWLAGEVEKSFLKDRNIHTVYNGVDLSVFKPIQSDFRRKYGLENKKILLGVAINWESRKGLDDLVRLSGIIPEDYQIIVVGLTSEQKKSLPAGIVGLRRTANASELAQIYSAADVFVNPSREETFGMVTAEAMACGTPAVVYNATASPELLSEDTGRVVEVGDIAGLRAGIGEVLEMGERTEVCRKRAELLFDQTKNLEEYYQIYARLIEERT
jgi:Glycosyltransferase